MTTDTKKARIAVAWAQYRAAATSLPRVMDWSTYIEADDFLWRRYLAAERDILSSKVA